MQAAQAACLALVAANGQQDERASPDKQSERKNFPATELKKKRKKESTVQQQQQQGSTVPSLALGRYLCT